MNKLIWFQFYPNDWVADTRPLTPTAKGAWIDILCAMWIAPERGKLTITIDGLARMIGCENDGAERILFELSEHKICEISPPRHAPLQDNHAKRHALVTLKSRRMIREENARESTRKRAEKYRVTHSSR